MHIIRCSTSSWKWNSVRIKITGDPIFPLCTKGACCNNVPSQPRRHALCQFTRLDPPSSFQGNINMGHSSFKTTLRLHNWHLAFPRKGRRGRASKMGSCIQSRCEMWTGLHKADLKPLTTIILVDFDRKLNHQAFTSMPVRLVTYLSRTSRAVLMWHLYWCNTDEPFPSGNWGVLVVQNNIYKRISRKNCFCPFLPGR